MISKIKNQIQVDLPTPYGELNIIAYAKDSDELMPHLALVNPDTNFDEVVNVRVHSECMTGDVFSSYRCECGEQLSMSLEYIGVNTGVLIYLRQEGRGIGLINKLHAYVKQDEGLDTAEANKVLGFGYDDRTYEDAIIILQDLNISNINLITNNPDKIRALDSSPSIKVHSRINLNIEARKENIGYLRTKKDKFKHLLK
ncbi:MAG: GTP cyclohydrolase II [Saprospiraceae bacterium]|nr:GTP cyclohydrolase II [Saprospiraceae bacterium]